MLKKVQNWIKMLISHLWQYIINCYAFFDRNYNLLFNSKNCVRILFFDKWLKYNDIITKGPTNFRYLGKGWYVIHNK